MDEELYGVKVDFDESKSLADYASVFQDLKFSKDTLERLIKLINEGVDDRIILQSLWTTALIVYVRCYASGKRYGLTKDVFEECEGYLEKHEHLKNMRDKHIAHSVNPFEQISVDLQLSNPNSIKKEVLAVSVLSINQVLPPSTEIEDLLDLVLVALKHVTKQCREYECKVLEVAKSLPIEDLYKNSRSKLIAPGPEQSGKPRNR